MEVIVLPDAGGIDIQLLGIGTDRHLGSNGTGIPSPESVATICPAYR